MTEPEPEDDYADPAVAFWGTLGGTAGVWWPVLAGMAVAVAADPPGREAAAFVSLIAVAGFGGSLLLGLPVGLFRATAALAPRDRRGDTWPARRTALLGGFAAGSVFPLSPAVLWRSVLLAG